MDNNRRMWAKLSQRSKDPIRASSGTVSTATSMASATNCLALLGLAMGSLRAELPPFLAQQSELILVEPAAISDGAAMAAQDPFVPPALRLVIEYCGKVAGQRQAAGVLEICILEEMVEQLRAR